MTKKAKTFIEDYVKWATASYVKSHVHIPPMGYIIPIVRGRLEVKTLNFTPTSPRGSSQMTVKEVVPTEDGNLFGVKMLCSFLKGKNGKRTRNSVANGIRDAILTYCKQLPTKLQNKVDKWLIKEN